jgi:hypothetical protein
VQLPAKVTKKRRVKRKPSAVEPEAARQSPASLMETVVTPAITDAITVKPVDTGGYSRLYYWILLNCNLQPSQPRVPRRTSLK